jgi:multidrug efflux system membrane fusion protein
MRRRALVAIVILAAAAAGSVGWLGRPDAPALGETPASAVPVSVAMVAKGDVPIELDALGRVKATNTVVVRAQITGQILKFAFEQGEPVAADQLLAQIDPRPFQAVVDQDQAVIARDRAHLANGEADLARYVPLVGKGVVSTQQVDTQRAMVVQLKATVAADQAALERDQVQFGFASIKAPLAGIAGIRFVDLGNIVGPNDPQGLVTIAQVQPIFVLFTLPQADLPEIKTGMADAGKTGLAVEALTQDDSRKLGTGRLSVIDNQIDPTSGTISLEATFPNDEGLLWPGAFVNVRLVLATKRDGLTIPATALQRGPGGPYVWTIADDDKARMQPVTVEQSLHGQVLISSGVSAGERVVTDGQYALSAGLRVAVQTAQSVAAGGTSPAATMRNPQPDRLGIRP